MNKGEEFIKQWGKMRNEKFNYFYNSSNKATLIKKWDFHEKEMWTQSLWVLFT
jgi:hypothetical protein